MKNEHCVNCGKLNCDCSCMTADVSESAQTAGSKAVTERILESLTLRIQRAGKLGRGCRITAEEARLLQWNNLPCTTEDISIRR